MPTPASAPEQLTALPRAWRYEPVVSVVWVCSVVSTRRVLRLILSP